MGRLSNLYSSESAESLSETSQPKIPSSLPPVNCLMTASFHHPSSRSNTEFRCSRRMLRMCLSLMVSGMSSIRGLPSRIRMRARKSCFSVGVSSLNCCAMLPMRSDFDLPRASSACSARVVVSSPVLTWTGRNPFRNEVSETVPVVNRKKRRFDALRPSRLYRTSQMRTDFQKSGDRSVRRSLTALCLSDARDLLPSLSTKSMSSSFSRKTAVFSGSCSNWSRARRAWYMYPRPCSPAEYLSVEFSTIPAALRKETFEQKCRRMPQVIRMALLPARVESCPKAQLPLSHRGRPWQLALACRLLAQVKLVSHCVS